MKITAQPQSFLVIEGIDGTGKTTTAIKLKSFMAAKGINYIYTDGFFGKFREEKRRYISIEPPHPQESFEFFLSAMRVASVEINRMLKSSHVVCDRYIYSTLAYHQNLGVNIGSLGDYDLIMPDFAFQLFVTDEHIRQQRLAQKKDVSRFDNLPNCAGSYLSGVETTLSSFGLLAIDTAKLTPDEVIDEIVRKIG